MSIYIYIYIYIYLGGNPTEHLVPKESTHEVVLVSPRSLRESCFADSMSPRMQFGGPRYA